MDRTPTPTLAELVDLLKRSLRTLEAANVAGQGLYNSDLAKSIRAALALAQPE
jgi:hypothetical protein